MTPFPRSVDALGRRRLAGAAVVLAVLCGGLAVWHCMDRDEPAGPTMETSPTETGSSAAAPPSQPTNAGPLELTSHATAADAPGKTTPAALPKPPAPSEKPAFAEARRAMVVHQLRNRGIRDAGVLAAMGRVPRHRFVAESLQDEAYDDHPLPIGHRQTISQPYVVALMTELATPKPGDRALDVGTGSGYQAAVLAELCKDVYGIEIVEPLADEAKKRLAALGYKNLTVRAGDGYRGWPEHAPFDVIILAAAADHVPPALVEQLAPGGRMVMPVGDYPQQLTVIEKLADGTTRRRDSIPVLFVPMTGEARKAR